MLPHLVNLTTNVSELLPPDWQAAVALLANSYGRRIERKSAGPGSLEEGGLKYVVVDGPAIEKYAPWLVAFFRHPTLAHLASSIAGEALEAGDDLLTALNINLLSGVGEKYEKHYDPQPYTMVVFANTLLPGEGGELAMWTASGEKVLIPPVAGYASVMDGSKTPHCVMPLLTDTQRLTIVMEFWRVGAGLDPSRVENTKYLYE